MDWLDTHSALLVSIGVSGYIAALHLAWARGDDEPAHRWVVAWCLAGIVFQGSRYIQLHTNDVDIAVTTARLYAAMGPVLIWSLYGFVSALREDPMEQRAWRFFTVATALLALLMGATDWFVPGTIQPEVDWFGESYIGVPAGNATLVLAPLIAGGLGYGVWSLWHTPELARADRVLLFVVLGLYAAMGLVSVLSAANLIPIPGLAEFAPMVVGVGLNQTLVRRHRRLRDHLEERVGERTQDLEFAMVRLREREAHFRALFDHVPAAVSVWSTAGDLIDLNRAARDLFAIDGPLPAVRLQDSDTLTRAGVTGLVDRAMREESTTHAELTLDVRVGALTLLLTAVPMRNPQRSVVEAVLVIGEDLAERRALEDALRHRQKLEALGALAGGIAHEINNPLAYVRSNLNSLRATWGEIWDALEKEGATPPAELTHDFEEMLDDSAAGVERALAVVRDVRGYAHDAPLATMPYALNALVGESVRVASIQCPSDVVVEEHYDEALPDVRCEPNRLRQVFVNLLSNAVQAVECGGRITVTTERADDAALVRIRDDGCGMDAETLARIQEPFFTTKPPGAGTGLGLYVTQGIVRAHQGSLDVSSTPGEGTVVTVALPLDRDAPA